VGLGVETEFLDYLGKNEPVTQWKVEREIVEILEKSGTVKGACSWAFV